MGDTEMLVWDHEEAAAQTSDEDIEDDWGRPRPKQYENGGRSILTQPWYRGFFTDVPWKLNVTN